MKKFIVGIGLMLALTCVPMLRVSAGELMPESVEASSTELVEPTSTACSHIGALAYFCNGEKTNSGTVTHKYGFAWTKTCSAVVFKSTARQQCVSCNTIIISIEELQFGKRKHECAARHANCGRGYEKVCSVGIDPPDTYRIEDEATE